MIKKAIFGSVVLVVLGTLVFGAGLASYVRTSAGMVKDSVKSSVPMSFQIERARDMIDDLVPEIRKNMYVIAKEEVQVARLEQQVADATVNLGTDKEELMTLRTDLADGDELFRYAGRSYTANQVKVDLANRFKRYQTNEATLVSLQDICNARQRSLEAAREKLEGMLTEKRELEVDVENLQARLQMVDAANTTHEYKFDDSQLGKARELVDDLRTRLEVAERMANAEVYYHDEIPVNATSTEDISDQIAEYFGENAPEVEMLAAE